MNSWQRDRKKPYNSFFRNFSIEKRTELKEKFISLWDKLGTIYHRYRANLTELGIAYEGMLYRNVIEQLDTDQLKYDKYIICWVQCFEQVESDFSENWKMRARHSSIGTMISSTPNKSKNMRPENSWNVISRNFRTNSRKAFSTPLKNRRKYVIFPLLPRMPKHVPSRMD